MNGDCHSADATMDTVSGVAWSGEGMSQDQLMLKDECIVLNYLDEVVGHDNKYNCHKFVPGQPRGILHRAFSVMLFNSKGEMLLQQRAGSKITFPDVWTNTCCTHPLHGMSPNEVDTAEQIATGKHVGVKHAAVRKLHHELGIPKEELEVKRFKFMTRVHYWAADVLSHGADAPWGEHEIDHLLLYRLEPGEELTLDPNPDEVQAVRWISRQDLMNTLEGHGKLCQEMPLWSPWFRIIAQRLLNTWWKDLDTALSTDEYVDTKTIHRFDPDPAFYGGAGGAGPTLDRTLAAERKAAAQEGGAAARQCALNAEHDDLVLGLVGRGRAQTAAGSEDVKQGAYGKVPTHKMSKIDQITRPIEVIAALRLKYGGVLKNNITTKDDDVLFCDKMLGKVSRSFAAVIRQLPQDMGMDICIFYLVLRALDTVEDDMTAYKGEEHKKKAELINFGAVRLNDPKMSLDGVGEGDERLLLKEFGKVVRVYKSLPKASQDVIRDITDKMGAGMAEYVSADLAQGTVDQAAYDRYCHKVAGLVGEGLTRLFVARGYESDELAGQGERVWPFCADPRKHPKNCGLANSMGLFLQKANIIRDYLEDYVDGRAFWPQSVWRKHSKTQDLGEFARPTAHSAGSRLPMKGSASRIVGKGVGEQALTCLNELVADALELVPDCLEYLRRTKTPGVYVFCAIPQLMAMATLCECVDNPKLFTGVVKIRKGLTCRLIQACVDGEESVHWWFEHLAAELLQRVKTGHCAGADAPQGARLAAACARICALTTKKAEVERAKKRRRIGAVCSVLAVGCAVAVASRS